MTTSPITPASPAAAARTSPPRPGAGTRLSVNHFGHAYSAPQSGATFDHPWRPALAGRSIGLRAGTIYSSGGDGVYQPKIKVRGQLVPMAGEAGKAAPQIALDAKVANAAGESWLALEVEPDEHGEIVKTTRLEIIHTASPTSRSRRVGRQPLVQILWKDGRPVQARAATHFNLIYTRVLDVVGARHFFT